MVKVRDEIMLAVTHRAGAEHGRSHEVERAPHNSTYMVRGEKYPEALRNFINPLAPAK